MKKIMFSDKFGLTEAVLAGWKTKTRRIITPQPDISDTVGVVWKGFAYGINGNGVLGSYQNFINGTEYDKSCRRYRVGEVVAIAQCYKDLFEEDCLRMKNGLPLINVTVKNVTETAGWNNKMFVRADQMRHHIRFTKVGMERLQDISDEDCIKEGVIESVVMGTNGSLSEYFVEGPKHICYGKTPREAYAVLIDLVSGKGTWSSNPYVFVYDFELVD